MTTNYDELRQAAKKSADSWEGSDPSWYILGDFRYVTGKEKPIAPPDAVDAAYIVCASPQAMLALLDENAVLREVVQDIVSDYEKNFVSMSAGLFLRAKAALGDAS